MSCGECERLKLAIRRARIRLERGADEPAIADDPAGAAASIAEAIQILKTALQPSTKEQI